MNEKTNRQINQQINRQDNTNPDFCMPAEFDKHHGTILIWPVRAGSWPYGGADAQRTWLRIASEIARGEKVYMIAKEEDFEAMKTAVRESVDRNLLPNIIFMAINTDDCWARDIGPTYVRDDSGNLKGIDWQFNAWGGDYNGLYVQWEQDDLFAGTFNDNIGVATIRAKDFVMEGGAIHVDGEGTCVVTECCLLSRGRNPDLTKEMIEKRLRKELGVQKVIWLPEGIYNDETDGHVDNVFAFVAPGEAVLAWTDDEKDPQYEMSRKDLKVLETETDARGRKINVHPLLIPKTPVTINEQELAGLAPEPGEDEREDGERLAASYVNFYIANAVVLVPQFGDENDERAIEVLRPLFPDREVVGIPARSIIVGGGNIHCITQQIPAWQSETPGTVFEKN